MQTVQAPPVHATSRRDGRSAPSGTRLWAARLRAVVVAQWQARRTEAELARMDPHLRRDIGLGEPLPMPPADLRSLWMR